MTRAFEDQGWVERRSRKRRRPEKEGEGGSSSSSSVHGVRSHSFGLIKMRKKR